MSRKHYKAVAEAIRLANSAPGYAAHNRSIVLAIAEAMKQDNPRFDLSRFLAACGY
jgi:hypothetical protein